MFELFKQHRKYNLDYFCTALVWHCNLNCKYCDHFSPLAEKYFGDKEKIAKDFKQISKFINVRNIGLMGGEPLLHPDLNYILELTRKIFPTTNLTIYTNGILLDTMSNSFWTTCHENKINIRISKYNININEKSIFQKAHKNRVFVEYYGTDKGYYKTMYKLALDLSGNQNADKMYNICWQNKGSCNFFEDGKLFQCSIAGNIVHFNKYFNKNLELTKNDFLDIYRIKSADEVAEYFNSKLDFCKYCNNEAQKSGLKFEISKREIKEWSL